MVKKRSVRDYHAQCMKCGDNLTAHKSGICQPCRSYECQHCGKYIARTKDGFRKVCGDCVKLAPYKYEDNRILEVR